MKEKLEYLLREKQLTATQLARLLEIQPSGISHIMSGRNKPSFDFGVKILSVFPDINPDWLMLDSDKIYRDDVMPGEVESVAATPSLDAQPLDFGNIEISANEKNEKNENCSVSPIAENSGKRMQRVIILYKDGSFESFTAK